MSIHEDIVQGLQEALEYVRGNLQLKSTIVEIPDEEIKFDGSYRKLPDLSEHPADSLQITVSV